MAKILIVDDDKTLVHVTKIALVKSGHEVNTAYSATQAIEEMKNKKPDLVLMDIMMPGISGAEAVKLLHQEPGLKDIPVLLLTGLISSKESDLQKNGINIEGLAYPTLGKPYEIIDLLIAIGDVLIKS